MLRSLILLCCVLGPVVAVTAYAHADGDAPTGLFGWIDAPGELTVGEIPTGSLLFVFQEHTFLANQRQTLDVYLRFDTSTKTAYRRTIPAHTMVELIHGSKVVDTTYKIKFIHPRIADITQVKFEGYRNQTVAAGAKHFLVKIWAPISVDTDNDHIDDHEDRCVDDDHGASVHLYGARIGCAPGQTVNNGVPPRR